MPLPPRWGDDTLTAFIHQAFQNTLATFVRKPQACNTLLRVDRAFMRIGENLINPPDVIGASLLLRSHSAYRAGVRLSMSGQAADTSPSLRACLEYALYALHIFHDPGHGEVWLQRHSDADAMRRMKNAFTHAEVMRTLQARDVALQPIVQSLYERTIDFGGYPNERAVTASMVIEREPGRVEMRQLYLHGDGMPLDHVLKTTAQIGLGALCLFQHVFKQRFEILGITDVLDQLRAEL